MLKFRACELKFTTDQIKNIDKLNAKKQLQNQKAEKRYALLSTEEKDKVWQKQRKISIKRGKHMFVLLNRTMVSVPD